MRLLDRYVFRELLTPLAFCLIGIQAVVVVFTVFGETDKMQERKLHFGDVIQYATASSLDVIWIVIPISLLLALLINLTEYARHNEITAMRAAGISLWRICAPYFVVGLLASVGLFIVNEFVVPHSSARAERIMTRYVHKPGDDPGAGMVHDFVNARAHRLWHFNEFHAGAATMSGPVGVSWWARDGSSRLLNADLAARTNGVWTFFQAEVFLQVTNANGALTLVPLMQANALAMPEFDETPREMAEQIKISSYRSLHNRRRAEIPLADIFSYLRMHPDLSPGDASWLLTMLHGRLAAPWMCLVVVLIAIPFGSASGRRNLFVGVAGSIFICFGYFVVQQISFAFGTGGLVPPWLAGWLPNLIFGAVGIVLMARVR